MSRWVKVQLVSSVSARELAPFDDKPFMVSVIVFSVLFTCNDIRAEKIEECSYVYKKIQIAQKSGLHIDELFLVSLSTWHLGLLPWMKILLNLVKSYTNNTRSHYT